VESRIFLMEALPCRSRSDDVLDLRKLQPRMVFNLSFSSI
jgi:hypothetical protein